MKEEKELAAVLCQRLAQREVSDATVSAFAKHLIKVGEIPARLDICAYGFCGDYYIERKSFPALFERLQETLDVRELRVFTHGILPPDKYMVHFEANLRH